MTSTVSGGPATKRARKNDPEDFWPKRRKGMISRIFAREIDDWGTVENKWSWSIPIPVRWRDSKVPSQLIASILHFRYHVLHEELHTHPIGGGDLIFRRPKFLSNEVRKLPTLVEKKILSFEVVQREPSGRKESESGSGDEGVANPGGSSLPRPPLWGTCSQLPVLESALCIYSCRCSRVLQCPWEDVSFWDVQALDASYRSGRSWALSVPTCM